jgi:hypothetical protein
MRTRRLETRARSGSVRACLQGHVEQLVGAAEVAGQVLALGQLQVEGKVSS